jgi:hypothetical protein
VSSGAGFGYVQARLQARYGRHPDEATWDHLHGAVELASFLDRARGTNLAPWVANFCTTSSVHEMESGLRSQFRALIDEVTGWCPREWRATVRWVKCLLDLPALYYIMQGRPAFGWMRDDPGLQPYVIEDAAARRRALSRLDAAPLLDAFEAGKPLMLAWIDEWRSRWPGARARERAQLEELTGSLLAHLRTFASAPPGQGWSARKELRKRVQLSFRRYLLQPAAAFSYLALVALDLERLRAELVSRELFQRSELIA